MFVQTITTKTNTNRKKTPEISLRMARHGNGNFIHHEWNTFPTIWKTKSSVESIHTKYSFVYSIAKYTHQNYSSCKKENHSCTASNDRFVIYRKKWDKRFGKWFFSQRFEMWQTNCTHYAFEQSAKHYQKLLQFDCPLFICWSSAHVPCYLACAWYLFNKRNMEIFPWGKWCTPIHTVRLWHG